MNILKAITLLSLMTVLALGPFSVRQTAAQPGISVPVQTFYNELAPYGQWLPNPNYGSVWVPNVGPDFQPYATDGHWVVTEFGNTWVSDYPWGWAPFHYGRWYFDNQYGWAWVPDSDWGPAWVSWRSGGGYYGWAPLAPGWDINATINIPAPYWTFVPQIYITSPSLYSYRVSRPNVVNIYQNTTIINNYYRSNNRAYVYGPPRGDIERVTRRSVPVYRIDPMDRPGRSVIGNGSVGFYRPGQLGGYGQGYNRTDRFDNSSRPDYRTNNPSNGDYYGRGNGSVGREYNGNNIPNREYNGNIPNREYNGGTTPNRGGYNGNYSTDRSGSYGNNSTSNAGNSMPNPGRNNTSPSNRFEPGRGGYSPDNSQQGNASPGNMTQPGRMNERFERPGQMDTQPTPGGRSEGSNFQRMPENRSMQPQQRSQEQPQQSQRSNNGSNPGAREQRGPR